MPTITTLYPSVSGGGTSLPATSSAAISAAAAAASAAAAAASAVEAANSAILAAPVATSLLALGATSSMNATAVGALNTAIATAFASGVRRIDGLDRTYAITGGTGLIIPQGMEFYNFEIDGSGMDNDTELVSVIGTQGSGTVLTANATVTTNTVQVASTAGYSRGQCVYIYDDGLFYSTTKNGQLNRILDVTSGTVLTLEKPHKMTFTTANNAAIAVLTSPSERTVIRDFRIIGGSDNSKTGQTGVWAQYCDGIDIINMDSHKFGYNHVLLYRCMDPVVRKPSMRRATDTGLAYGISASFGSSGVRVEGGDASDMRHAFATGGGSAGGVNMDIIVSGMITSGTTDAGLDSHGSSIDVLFANNIINGAGSYGSSSKDGITMQGINMRAIGNIITGVGRHGILMQPAVSGGPYFGGGTYDIVDNMIESPGQAGISVGVATSALRSVNIRGGSIRNSNVGGANAAILVSASAGNSITTVDIKNVEINTSASRGIRVTGTGASSTVGFASISGCTFRNITSENIYVEAISSGAFTRAKISDNDTDGGTIGIRSVGLGTLVIDGSNTHANNTAWNVDATTAIKYLTPEIGVTSRVTVTNDYTVVNGIRRIISNRAATNTITLPAASEYPNRQIYIKTIQAQAVDSASSNVVPIDSATAGTAILPATDGAWALLESDGTNWIIIAKGP